MASRQHYQCTPQYRRSIAPYKMAKPAPTLSQYEGNKFSNSAAGAPRFYRAGVQVW